MTEPFFTNKEWGAKKCLVPRRASQGSAQFHVHDISNLIMPMFKKEKEEGKVSFNGELNLFFNVWQWFGFKALTEYF